MKLSVINSADFRLLQVKLDHENKVAAALIAITCLHGAWRISYQILSYSFDDLPIKTTLNSFDLALSTVKFFADAYILTLFALLFSYFVG